MRPAAAAVCGVEWENAVVLLCEEACSCLYPPQAWRIPLTDDWVVFRPRKHTLLQCSLPFSLCLHFFFFGRHLCFFLNA